MLSESLLSEASSAGTRVLWLTCRSLLSTCDACLLGTVQRCPVLVQEGGFFKHRGIQTLAPSSECLSWISLSNFSLLFIPTAPALITLRLLFFLLGSASTVYLPGFTSCGRMETPSLNEGSLCMQVEMHPWIHWTQGHLWTCRQRVGALSWLCVLFPFSTVSEIHSGGNDSPLSLPGSRT